MSDGTKPPWIRVEPPQYVVNEKMFESLKHSKGLYQRSEQIVQVNCESAKLPLGVDRPSDAPTINMVGPATLSSKLSECAVYERLAKVLNDGTEVMTACHPPAWGVDWVKERRAWPLPALEGIVEAPVLLSSGKILFTTGYDEFSGLYFAPPPGISFLPVPEFPTAENIAVAQGFLNEAVCDFPFEKLAHRAAWKAGVLSYFARPAYEGQTPGFLIDGNTPGTGKGKLAGTAAQICLGRKPMVLTQTPDEKKEGEQMTAVALSGEMMVLIDNINYPLGSSALDSVLTEGIWSAVLKYANNNSKFVMRNIWWFNGNNVQFRKQNDTKRRAVKIRIESPLENPEERTDFKRPEPEYGQWLKANRPQLVWAALTLLKGFVQAGSPSVGLRSWGSFESWSHLVRGTLVWAGDPDPYEVAASHDQTADSLTDALGELLRGWKLLCTELKVESLSAQEALTELRCHIEYSKADGKRSNLHERLISALCELSPPKGGRLPDAGALGYAFRRVKRRVVGGLYLEPVARGGDLGTAWAVVRSRA